MQSGRHEATSPPLLSLAPMTRDPAFLAECQALSRALAAHPTIAALRASAAWPELAPRLERVLGAVRAQETPVAPAASTRDRGVRAVHWNIEHGNRFAQIEAALTQHPELADADLYLLNEVDLGMARSGNRDVAADLARTLGRYAAWAPLLIETTRGRDDDLVHDSGSENTEALFGLAILSRWPLTDARIVALPSPERWQFDLERMYGRHIALIVTVERPGAPFVAVAAHLEVHRTRAHRAAQMRVMMDALGDERRPVLLAGDFNTHTFDRGLPWSVLAGATTLMLTPGAALSRRLRYPDRGAAREPLFDVLRAARFEWDAWVDRTPTLQMRFDRIEEARRLPRLLTLPLDRALAWAESRAALRLDWFAGRGWDAGRGFTVSGLDGPGRASDHAPIVAEIE